MTGRARRTRLSFGIILVRFRRLRWVRSRLIRRLGRPARIGIGQIPKRAKFKLVVAAQTRAAQQIKQRGGGEGEAGSNRVGVEQARIERIPGERMARASVQFVRPGRLAGRLRRGDGER